MKSLLLSLVAATVLGVVMSLPFQRGKKLEQLIPLARSLGATKFAHFVREANLTANFTRKAGNFTLFVPDNAAFEGLSKNITRNKTLLAQLVLFHSVNGTYNRSELIRNKNLTTLSGGFLYFNHTKKKVVLVNNVTITGFNKRASNGFIFLVSKVILEGSGLVNKTNNKKSGQVRRQAYVLCRNGTWGVNCTIHGNGTHGNGTHGNYTHITNTVSQPIVHASGRLCRNGFLGINCTQHGNGTHGNGTHGNGTLCRNGFWGINCTHYGNGTHGNGTHGNGTLCLNGFWGINCTRYGNGTHGNGTHGNGTHGNMTHGSITHILSLGYGQYSTLIADLMKSGVWSELERPQVTLLAPTNAAFSKLPTAYRNNLDNHAKFLESTMMYHVLDGIHAPTSLHQNDMLTSLEGHRIHVSMQNGHVQRFNKASILNVIHATNGVIYVLDGVLHLPSNPIV
ncbi:uncharacterized protein LOC124111522 isoform X2 [Haliotis rufescens]|uniref:uncharacterized protein LOC124111522 isoform X2 n=1 Tax=Haliotis rufescens TaxID=6454 RepID=UPI00201E8F18|nr:uncharacterized protein LOC124111522 isoform X2 [Haliotis rufescens]